MLKNHADFLAHLLNVLVSNFGAIKGDFAGSWLFHAVDTAKKSGFAGAGRTENDDAFAFFELKIDAL